MFLTQADKQAAHDGFKFLVLSPSGARKCYCTTVKEAKREAGKGGKIVSLGRMRYTTQNPGGKKQRARKVRSFGEYVAGQPRGAEELHAGRLLQAASERKKIAGLRGMSPHYVEDQAKKLKLYHAQSLKEAARLRKTGAAPNPSARMVGLQRNPKGKGMVPFSELAVGDRFKFGGDKCKKISKTKFQIEASGPFPATTVDAQPWYNVTPIKRNPTWLTTGLLAGAAYVYGRSAKVREKIKGAIERAHKKLENPTARMVGMQRNPDRYEGYDSESFPPQWYYLTDGVSLVAVGKYAKDASARRKAKVMVARDLELRGMRLVTEAEVYRKGSTVLTKARKRRRNPTA